MSPASTFGKTHQTKDVMPGTRQGMTTNQRKPAAKCTKRRISEKLQNVTKAPQTRLPAAREPPSTPGQVSRRTNVIGWLLPQSFAQTCRGCGAFAACASSPWSSCRSFLMTAPYPPSRVNKAILSVQPIVPEGAERAKSSLSMSAKGHQSRRFVPVPTTSSLLRATDIARPAPPGPKSADTKRSGNERAGISRRAVAIRRPGRQDGVLRFRLQPALRTKSFVGDSNRETPVSSPHFRDTQSRSGRGR